MVAYVIAYILMLLAVILTGRYLYRLFTGKVTQCSCGSGTPCSMSRDCGCRESNNR